MLPTAYDREPVRGAGSPRPGADRESAAFLSSHCLPHASTTTSSRPALAALAAQQVTRHGGAHTAELARRIAACSYEVEFPPSPTLAERVLWPHEPVRVPRHGGRPLRARHRGRRPSYRATYTAFDGAHDRARS